MIDIPNNMSDLVKIQNEINAELANKEVFTALVSTTFKGLEPKLVKRAIMEGMMRGFKFKDFLEKNIYAIPYKGTYSLITSIDYARKIGMRNGVIGKSAPAYEFDENKKPVSCTVTITRKAHGVVGAYTATVYFDEYTTGFNLWKTKPKTMIAKVAEMHALRMACPEELAQSYIEEEMSKEVVQAVSVDLDAARGRLEAVKSLSELKSVWSSLPSEAKTALEELKNSLKTYYENPQV